VVKCDYLGIVCIPPCIILLTSDSIHKRPGTSISLARISDASSKRISRRLKRRRALEHRRLVSTPLLHIHRKDEGVKRTFAYVANNFVVSR